MVVTLRDKEIIMYLSRFGVKNYKCLGDIDIPLTPIHVLIGQNDAGKTSLLEAMAAYCRSAEKELHELFAKPWSGRELVLHGQREPIIEFWGEWQTFDDRDPTTRHEKLRYGFAVAFPETGADCWTHAEWIGTGGQRQGLVLPGPRCAFTCIRYKKRRNLPPQNVSDDALDTVSKTLGRVHQYSLNPKAMRLPAAIDPSRTRRLDADGFGLPTLLGDILDYDAELFIRLRAEFGRFFPQFKSVRIESENAYKRAFQEENLFSLERGLGKALYFETHSGESIKGQQASDGAVLFLGFLALAHLPDPPTVLLIEEPENAIYPKRLGEVISMLKQMVERPEGVRFPQIILTTHSPYVLSFFKPEEVTFLSRTKDRPDAPVRARPLRDSPKIKEGMGSEFYLGELWYNMTEEELFGEC